MKLILLGMLSIAMISTTLPAQTSGVTWNKNQVIAHRGAWKKNKFPENSIASLNEAIRLKCFGSEFDVYIPTLPIMDYRSENQPTLNYWKRNTRMASRSQP